MTTLLGTKIFRGLYYLRMNVDDITPALNSILSHMPEERLELNNNILSVHRRYLKTGVYQENKIQNAKKTPTQKETMKIEKNDTKCDNKKSDKKEEGKMVKNKIIKITKKKAVVSNIFKTNSAEKGYAFKVKPTLLPTKSVIRTDSCINSYQNMKPIKSVSDKYMTYNKYDKDYLDEQDMCKQNQSEISMIEPVKFRYFQSAKVRSVEAVLPRVSGQWRNESNANENQSKLNLKDFTYSIAKKHLRPDPPKSFPSISLPINFLGDTYKKKSFKKVRENTHYKELQTGKASTYSVWY